MFSPDKDGFAVFLSDAMSTTTNSLWTLKHLLDLVCPKLQLGGELQGPEGKWETENSWLPIRPGDLLSTPEFHFIETDPFRCCQLEEENAFSPSHPQRSNQRVWKVTPCMRSPVNDIAINKCIQWPPDTRKWQLTVWSYTAQQFVKHLRPGASVAPSFWNTMLIFRKIKII